MIAGLEETGPFSAKRCDSYLGTSAGSIVAAMLSAGVDTRSRLEDLPEPPPSEEAEEAAALPAPSRALRLGASVAGAAAGPLASVWLRASAPGGRLLRRAALARVPEGPRSLDDLGKAVRDSGASWDGRLRISAVELERGRRVIFDGSEDPAVSVAEAVQASCAIPGVFRPVILDGRSYVDGGAWSPTNMDAAEVRRGSRVLCLVPTAALRPARGSPFGALGPVSRSVAAIEAAALRRRGAEVQVVSPDRESVAAMGGNLMDPSRRSRVVAAGLAQGQRLS